MAVSVKPRRFKFLRCLKKLFLWGITMVVIGIISVITPIFANSSAFLLNLFSELTLPPSSPPTATVVLGGGLTKSSTPTLDKDGNLTNAIILNHYSQSRADTVIDFYYPEQLPIITSGAESPWLQDYLKSHLESPIIISDNASMNTCENAIFTAKLLHHHELTDSIYLVTDRYHMARARRQFYKEGIATTPHIAPLAIQLDWQNIDNNLVHSRRALYELAALTRDIVAPQNNCRNSEQITLEEISTPRRKPKVFSQSSP